MSAANPQTEVDRDIPLREIPATIRDLRERWSMEYTMRGKLERENEELRAQIAKMIGRDSRNVDDLTDHCARQGAYIARLESDKLALHDRLLTAEAQAAQAWRKYDIERRDNLAELHSVTGSQMYDTGRWLEALGQAQCPMCFGGDGIDRESMVYYRANDLVENFDYEWRAESPCSACIGTGRVLPAVEVAK